MSLWAPSAKDAADGRAGTHPQALELPNESPTELPTGPTWQQMARNNAATFVAKLDGQGMAVAIAALNDSFSRNLWAQCIFVEAFVMKGGISLICRLASAASDDASFYQ